MADNDTPQANPPAQATLAETAATTPIVEPSAEQLVREFFNMPEPSQAATVMEELKVPASPAEAYKAGLDAAAKVIEEAKAAEPVAHPPLKCTKCGKDMVYAEYWTDQHLIGYNCECGYNDYGMSLMARSAQFNWGGVSQVVQRLVKYGPNNPTTRALVEEIAADRLPASCKTESHIINWFVYRKPREVGIKPYPPRSVRNIPPFDVELTLTEVNTGRCRYSVEASGSRYYAMRAEHLLEIINTCFEEETSNAVLMARIREYFYDDFPDVDTETDQNSYTYSDHETNDSEATNREVNINSGELESWMRDANPQAAEYFFG